MKILGLLLCCKKLKQLSLLRASRIGYTGQANMSGRNQDCWFANRSAHWTMLPLLKRLLPLLLFHWDTINDNLKELFFIVYYCYRGEWELLLCGTVEEHCSLLMTHDSPDVPLITDAEEHLVRASTIWFVSCSSISVAFTSSMENFGESHLNFLWPNIVLDEDGRSPELPQTDTAINECYNSFKNHPFQHCMKVTWSPT